MVRRWRKRIKSKIKYTREHILYFGYGMNTNLEQMAGRCPGSKSLGHATLYDHEFSFRTFADVYPRQGSKVEGVLWKITPDNLKALDALEGYPFMYDRKRVPVVHKGKVVWALTYYMVSLSRWGAPSDGYVDRKSTRLNSSH